MKRIAITTAIIFLIISNLKSQQLPLYSQYMLNSFLINPAIAGSSDFVPIILTARNQWAGIENAPRTQAISGHTMTPRQHVGLGGYFFNDNYGPIRSTGILGAYSYHIKLNKLGTKIAMGISVSAFQYRLSKDEIVLHDQEDAVVNQSRESLYIPDANFGLYVYNSHFFAGISGAQLFQYKVKFVENSENYSKVTRHYYLTAGYRFNIKDRFMIEPSTLVKATEATPVQVDLNARVYYKTNYWLGVSYRTGDAIVAMAGMRLGRYFFGYAYDFTLSEIMNYSYGSHEIMLGIDMGDPNKIIKSPRYL